MAWASLYEIQVSIQLHKSYCVYLSGCYCLVIQYLDKSYLVDIDENLHAPDKMYLKVR